MNTYKITDIYGDEYIVKARSYNAADFWARQNNIIVSNLEEV